MTNVKYVPAALETSPTTTAEALAAARSVIEDEGRWAKETWYKHADTDHPEYEDNPFCNGWETCAAGALQLVTLGLSTKAPYDCGVETCTTCNSRWHMPGIMHSPSEYTPEERMYVDGLQLLSDEVEARTGDPDRWNIVPRFNDNPKTTRADVIEVFRAAEAKALAAEKVPA